MINGIWLALILASVLCAAFTGRMEALSKGTLESARGAVDLVIGLVGAMVLFLGLMRVAREGGLLDAVARGLAPVLKRLFPDVPPEHPAMGAIIMNLAANVLGLGNAATPFGLKAMLELEKLNPRPGVASDAMVLFLAINASSVSLFPLGTIAVRASAGSQAPAAIWIPTLIATTASTLTAVLTCLALGRLPRFRPSGPPPKPDAHEVAAEPAAQADTQPVFAPARPPPPSGAARALVVGFGVALLAAAVLHLIRASAEGPLWGAAKHMLSFWLLPLLIAALVLVGVRGRVRVYEAAVEGGREGLEVAIRILPFLVVILVAVGMFRSSGAMDLLIRALGPLTSAVGFPAEALPMAILRPLSGSGAFGVMSEILQTRGPDSFVGMLVSSLQGSTETTFYVLALYFGAARVRDGRHALLSCLAGDLAGVIGATWACHLFFD